MIFGFYDRSIIGAYFAAVLAFGFILRRRIHNSPDYLSNRLLPLWATGIGFMATIVDSLEISVWLPAAQNTAWLSINSIGLVRNSVGVQGICIFRRRNSQHFILVGLS